MPVKCLCEYCGKQMLRSPSHVRGRVFCNQKCRSMAARPEHTCEGCGRLFRRDPTQPHARHCSWGCYRGSRFVEEACHVCEKRFQSYLSEHRKRQQRRHVTCCSRACRNVYTSLFLGGDGTWVPGGRYNKKRVRGWKWRKARLRYLRHVGFTCEGCGAHATAVHHLHQTAGGGPLLDPANFMAVCNDCHDNMHEQLREGAFWDSFEGIAFDRVLAERETCAESGGALIQMLGTSDESPSILEFFD